MNTFYKIIFTSVLVFFAACHSKSTSSGTPERKTFANLKQHALFLDSGHDKYGVFSDDEIKIIKVTNLDKSGEGSFAWAVVQSGPRIVVFEVGGVIDLEQSKLNVTEPYLFIAGQTAPAPGITLIKGGMKVNGHDVIIQHISIRSGDCGGAPESGWEVDGLCTTGTYNVVIDHCSFTWATDENLSASGPRHKGADKTSHDITFSNNIISEGLYQSTHKKGIHSMGTLIHDYCRNIAIVGNLYSHNNERNPVLKPNAAAYVANNLIYNPKNAAIHAYWPVVEYINCPDSMRHANLTAIGNVLIPGIDTKKDMYLMSGKMSVYHQDNMICLNVNDRKGNKINRMLSPESEEKQTPVIQTDRYRAIPSGDVAASVLKNAGMRPKMRDAIDQRIVADVKNGSGKLVNGQDEVGGYPQRETTRQPLSVPAKNVEKWLEKLSGKIINK